MRGRSLADRLSAAAGSWPDLPAVMEAVCAAVAQDVPNVFGCFATTEPATGLITGAYKTHPLPVGDEEFAAAEYGPPDVNRFVDLARRPSPVGVLSIDTDGRPETCRRFRTFLAPRFGFTDELRVVFLSRGVSWGALALYRGAGDARFTAADARLLAGISELVADAIRRTLFATAAPDAGPAKGPAVLVVDAADRVTDLTPAARQEVEDLGGWQHGSLPTSVLAVVATARTAPDRATTRVLGRSGRWLSLRAAPLSGTSAPADVVVTIDAAPRAELSRLALTARGLTAREQDVAVLVLQGADTRAIAAALHLSPHTVQDHLKAVFAKLEVTSRREMVARLILS